MESIGKLKKVELRDVWPNEAYDFTTWLAEDENLELLSESIGIDISLIEKESKIGGFSADIYGEEDGTGKKVIIENQLEDTNHDHLGKIITYASGKDANYIIWIVKHARDEHRRAIEWLNEHTDSEIRFFLLEIEIWKIGDSQPAPKFNVVEQPNDWAKVEKKSLAAVSERDMKCLRFWEEFKSYAETNKSFTKEFSLRKPHPQNWYDLSVGISELHISMNIQLSKNTLDTGIYIPEHKELFEELKSHQSEIENKIGGKLIWHQASKASRLKLVKSANINDSGNWQDCFDWLIKMDLLFKEVIKMFIVNK